MLNVHRHEETSVRAARQFFQQEPCGGQITWVDHGRDWAPTRNVSFTMGGRSYTFDPDRVFTKRGRELSLGANGAPEAAVSAFVDQLLQIYGWSATEHVITLHNTGGSYGANSYMAGQFYASEASRVLVQGGTSTMVLLTRSATYDCFVASKAIVSLVLQTPNINNVVDASEGSLAHFAEVAKKDFIHSDAYHGVMRDQMLVLKTAVDVCLLKRSALAADEIQQKAGTTYCTDARFGRTGTCVPAGSACTGYAMTPQSGCGAGQDCCVAGGCTHLAATPQAPGKCVVDSQCPSGAGYASNNGVAAIGCHNDPGPVKCCTSFQFAPIPAVTKPTAQLTSSVIAGEPTASTAPTNPLQPGETTTTVSQITSSRLLFTAAESPSTATTVSISLVAAALATFFIAA